MPASVPSRREDLAHVVPASSMPVFAHERLLPVPDALHPLFAVPDGSRSPSSIGLVRGQTVVCTGSAGMSCALGLASGVTQAGSWAAFVGLPSIGLLAAAMIGVSLERTVFVSRPIRDPRTNQPSGGRRDEVHSEVGTALSALIDGIDLVVVSQRLVSTLPSSLVRRLQTRAQSKGSILVIIGDASNSVSVDLRLTARTVRWEGLGDGHGHLRRRLVSIEMDGRRRPQRRDHVVWLPDTTGGMSAVDDVHFVSTQMDAGRRTDSECGVVIALHRETGSRS